MTRTHQLRSFTGGTTIDPESITVINSILDLLESYGLEASV